jgi:hypothetical protein
VETRHGAIHHEKVRNPQRGGQKSFFVSRILPFLVDVTTKVMPVIVGIRNGGGRIARRKRVFYRAIESGLTDLDLFFDGVLMVASVH